MERDYKVVYRSRQADLRGEGDYDSRRRIPTALDPYEYPEDYRELKRNIAEVKARNKRYQDAEYVQERQDTVARPSVSRTAYQITDDRPHRDAASVRSAHSFRPVARDDDTSERRGIRVERPLEHYLSDRNYTRERPRHSRDGYVVDVRDAEVVGVYTGRGAREGDRYERDRDDWYRTSNETYRDREGPRSSAPSLHNGPYMSGARLETSRSQNEFRPARARDEEDRALTATDNSSRVSRRDEEWDFVEKTTIQDANPVRQEFRDPFNEKPSETARGRRRASTLASEHEYVMVTPPRDNTLRSALATKDRYSVDERDQRRRSRSTRIRDEDVLGHYCGEKFAERPGAEAAMMGKYLRHYDADERDGGNSSRNHRRDERYAPQRFRSRSRRRRDHDDDESYISARLTRTVKDTYI